MKIPPTRLPKPAKCRLQPAKLAGNVPADDGPAVYPQRRRKAVRAARAPPSRGTKMDFNRIPFQFSPDFGHDRAPSPFRDHFDEQFEPPSDMFSEGAPPGRWDPAADMPRFHVVRMPGQASPPLKMGVDIVVPL